MLNKFKRLKNQSNIVFKSRFLANLSHNERYEFLQLCHRRSYKEGEYVFYKNDPGTGMYFIEDGRIELTLKTPEEIEQSDNKEEGFILEPSESFGVLSIGYDLRRKSSARCLTNCELLGFFKPDFEVLKSRHPQIAVKFMQTLSSIALRQLEVTTNRLARHVDEDTALKIQFDTYFEDQLPEDIL